jgi:ABC-type oligopeptide transport system ATPase subunit
MLQLEGVSKVYRVGTFGRKALRAVDNVSFDVKDREVVALIGESGSGKTTIGKMILRLTPITSGTIRFNGIDISTLKDASSKIITERCKVSSKTLLALTIRSSRLIGSLGSSRRSSFLRLREQNGMLGLKGHCGLSA